MIFTISPHNLATGRRADGGVSPAKYQRMRVIRTEQRYPSGSSAGKQMMIIFDNDEAEYLKWVEANPTAFVLNAPKVPNSIVNRLHKATCKTIQSPKRSNYTTTTYKKICSFSRNELANWAKNDVNGYGECGLCKP